MEGEIRVTENVIYILEGNSLLTIKRWYCEPRWCGKTSFLFIYMPCNVLQKGMFWLWTYLGLIWKGFCPSYSYFPFLKAQSFNPKKTCLRSSLVPPPFSCIWSQLQRSLSQISSFVSLVEKCGSSIFPSIWSGESFRTGMCSLELLPSLNFPA